MPGLEDHTIVPTRRGYIRQALERIEVFSAVSPELLDEVAAEFRSADAAPGEAVVRQDDPGDQLFVVEDGQLEATAAINGRTVKLVALVAVPPAFVIRIGPLLAETGTVARSEVSETIVKAAVASPTVTFVAPVNPEPVTVTSVPAVPAVGVNEATWATAGGGTVVTATAYRPTLP